MKVLIDIPEEYELDYKTDRFSEFFQRCRADMDVCCGTYERETSDMLEKEFTQSEIYEGTNAGEDERTKVKRVNMEFDEIIRNTYNDRKTCIMWKSISEEENRYLYYYAEKEVYMVLDTLKDKIIIIKARSPLEALERAKEE